MACASTAASGTPVFAASLVAHTNPRPSPIGVERSSSLAAPTHEYTAPLIEELVRTQSAGSTASPVVDSSASTCCVVTGVRTRKSDVHATPPSSSSTDSAAP